MSGRHEEVIKEDFEQDQKEICLVLSRRYLEDIPAWWVYCDQYFYARVRLNLNSGNSYHVLELRKNPPTV